MIKLTEPDDHIVQLEIDGQVIARFRRTGITIQNILKEVESHGREN